MAFRSKPTQPGAPPTDPEKQIPGSLNDQRRFAESEARFRVLFEKASDASLVFDAAGTITDANPRMGWMLDCPPEAVRGQSLAGFLPPEDWQKMRIRIERLRDGDCASFAIRLRRSDGRLVDVEQSVSRIHADQHLALCRAIGASETAAPELRQALHNAEDSEHAFEEAISRVNAMAMEAEVASLEMDQVFNATSDGICVIDKDLAVSRFNRVLEEMMAPLGVGMAKGRCSRILHHALCGTERCLLKRILEEDRDRLEEEIEIVSPEGETHTLIVSARPLMDLTAEIVGVVESYRDITERKQIEQELRRMAVTDPLTGAFNRRQFLERAQEEIDRSRRYQTALTLLMIDIDHFKAVNDTFGHDAGDAVLKAMVAESKAQLRGSDIFCRLGGEEFAAILTHTPPDLGRLAAERLRQALGDLEVGTSKGRVRFTVSIGVASMAAEAASLDQILKRADDALYEAKQQGRNRVIPAE